MSTTASGRRRERAIEQNKAGLIVMICPAFLLYAILENDGGRSLKIAIVDDGAGNHASGR